MVFLFQHRLNNILLLNKLIATCAFPTQQTPLEILQMLGQLAMCGWIRMICRYRRQLKTYIFQSDVQCGVKLYKMLPQMWPPAATAST